jgi:primary-amine oxidase
MDLLAPNKSDVLAYLSGKTSAPDRYAHATILFGATKDMYQQDFILGPLPVSDKTKLIPRSYPSRKDGKLNVIWNIGTTLAFADTVKTSASKALKSLWNMV